MSAFLTKNPTTTFSLSVSRHDDTQPETRRFALYKTPWVHQQVREGGSVRIVHRDFIGGVYVLIDLDDLDDIVEQVPDWKLETVEARETDSMLIRTQLLGLGS